jgi:hypothetical protein
VKPCGICGGQSGTGHVLSEFFDFPLSISFRHGALYPYITWRINDRVRWQLQFRDVVLPHRHEQLLTIFRLDITHCLCKKSELPSIKLKLIKPISLDGVSLSLSLSPCSGRKFTAHITEMINCFEQ